MNHLPKKLIDSYGILTTAHYNLYLYHWVVFHPIYTASNRGQLVSAQILSFQAWWRWRNDAIPNLGNHKIHVVAWVGRKTMWKWDPSPNFLYGCANRKHCAYKCASVHIIYTYIYIFTMKNIHATIGIPKQNISSMSSNICLDIL